MNELVPGLWHWTAPHDHINSEVSSYYLSAERVIIDPMLPPGGLAWFEQHGPPAHALLSNRHHDRQAWRLHEAFGTTVHCIRNGVYELDGRGPVEPFDFGDELPGRRGRRTRSIRSAPTRPRCTSPPTERWRVPTVSSAARAKASWHSSPTF